MKLLADYVEFFGAVVPSPTSRAQSDAAPAATSNSTPAGSSTAQLKHGMKMEEVTTLLGPGNSSLNP